MKRIFSLFLAFAIMVSLCGCQGNFGSVNLSDTIEIPDDGIINESIIKQINSENAIGVFAGKSDGLQYEWTIFGSDITDAKEINLRIQLSQTNDGEIQVELTQTEAFGFPALLSVYLNEQWTAQSATAYVADKAVASVVLTGSKNTTLNIALNGTEGTFVVRQDPLPEDAVPATEGNENSSETTAGEQDAYLTDPIPEGKPGPVEPEEQNVDAQTNYTCTFSIECSTILNNLDKLDPAKLEMVPSGGVILSKTTVTFYEGESVFDVLQRVCTERGIHMESSWTPIYNSAYVEGIHNLYEFDCGELSGWMYRVNGWYPNYGCSRYQLKDGDVVEWRFTCDLGNDIGGGYAVGG